MKIDSIEDFYPLSPMQQGMMFNSLYSPQSGIDIKQIIYTLPEKINVPAFAQNWLLNMERKLSLYNFSGSFFEAPTIAGLSSLIQDICLQIQGGELIGNKSDDNTWGEL